MLATKSHCLPGTQNTNQSPRLRASRMHLSPRCHVFHLDLLTTDPEKALMVRFRVVDIIILFDVTYVTYIYSPSLH